MFNPDEEKYLLSTSGAARGDCRRPWVCRDGHSLLIAEMEDSHLLNSMMLVARKWPWRASYYHCLVDEARKRGLI